MKASSWFNKFFSEALHKTLCFHLVFYNRQQLAPPKLWLSLYLRLVFSLLSDVLLWSLLLEDSSCSLDYIWSCMSSSIHSPSFPAHSSGTVSPRILANEPSNMTSSLFWAHSFVYIQSGTMCWILVRYLWDSEDHRDLLDCTSVFEDT